MPQLSETTVRLDPNRGCLFGVSGLCSGEMTGKGAWTRVWGALVLLIT